MKVRMGVAAAIVAVLMSGGLSGCAAGPGGDATGDPYKIGAVLSLSGTYAGLGESEKAAIEMEVERINADGGVHGRPVEVVIKDDATDEAQAQAAVTELIDQEEVLAVIGATGTGQTMAMRTEIDAAGVPQVSMAGGTVITQQYDPLVFQTPWSNTLVVPFVLREMKDDGITKVALISDTGGYGKDGQGVILNAAPAVGIEIVAAEEFNPGDTDMTTQLGKVKASGAEAILMWTAGREAVTIVKNAEQLRMGLPIFGGSGIAREEFIEGAGQAAEGVRFGTGKVLLPEAYGEGTEAYVVADGFRQRYSERYGKAPDIFAGHAYDALNLVVEAMRRVPAETLDGDRAAATAAIRDEIEKTSGFVGIGGTFTFSPTDHNGISADDLVMYEVVGGTWRLAP